MNLFHTILVISCLLVNCPMTNCFVEPGYKVENFELKEKNVKVVNFTKSMYEGTQIMFMVDCKPDKDRKGKKRAEEFQLKLLLLYHPCHLPGNVVDAVFDQNAVSVLHNNCGEKVIFGKLDQMKTLELQEKEKSKEAEKVATAKAGKDTSKGTGKKERRAAEHSEKIEKDKDKAGDSEKIDKDKDKAGTTGKKVKDKTGESEKIDKDEDKAGTTGKKVKDKTGTKDTKRQAKAGPMGKKSNEKVGENKLPLTMKKGLYTLQLQFSRISGSVVQTFKVRIDAKHGGSYLSAQNWPLLPFFGVMSLLYLAFAIGWFIASCCNWRDLLRVQFWIGGVIALGMFENALFYTEYRNINSSGKENGLLYFAEIMSCVKRALARILVIIVSMGFGIVKPRLGQTLHKVLAVGVIYVILAAVEACIRVGDENKIVSKRQMYALVPLTVLDVALCWWVFTSLVQTTRTLRIRKNIVKLTLYRHFTNTLIFTVIASLAYMIWMIKQAKFTDCIDVSSLWLNDALWPFLFAVILAVIMILWRPSNNNQRYAFTPLDIGDSEDENDDMTLSEAFEGMKMRNKSDSQSNGTTKNRNKAEDDLKWVEENIPSVPSTLLPTIDSDEEILTTKFEISKMD